MVKYINFDSVLDVYSTKEKVRIYPKAEQKDIDKLAKKDKDRLTHKGKKQKEKK